MIPKTCPLNDKHKLQTTLQNKCTIENYSETAEDCKGCQYQNKRKKTSFSEMVEKEIKRKSMEDKLKILAKLGLK